jgi:hypothetical protein
MQMRMKNYQEDIVYSLIDLALEEYPDLKSDTCFIDDVAAFTLNRIPPCYMTGERGFSHFAVNHFLPLKDDNLPDDLVETLVLINMAIQVLQNRRKDSNHVQTQGEDVVKERVDYGVYTHNFPHIIGKIVDDQMQIPLYGISVTLYINNALADSAQQRWPNPYITQKATRGIFSFWPAARVTQEEESDYILRLHVQAEGYSDIDYEKHLKIKGSYSENVVFQLDNVLNLSTIRMTTV